MCLVCLLVMCVMCFVCLLLMCVMRVCGGYRGRGRADPAKCCGMSVCVVYLLLGEIEDEGTRIPLPKSPEDPGTMALTDCLTLLGCKEMKVCYGNSNKEDPDTLPNQEEERARITVLSQIMKRNMCENTVPTLLELR